MTHPGHPPWLVELQQIAGKATPSPRRAVWFGDTAAVGWFKRGEYVRPTEADLELLDLTQPRRLLWLLEVAAEMAEAIRQHGLADNICPCESLLERFEKGPS